MVQAVIVDAVRTPIGKRNGSLADIHPVDMSGQTLKALAERNKLEPSMVDDVIWGCVNQVGDQAAQIGRYAVLAAGWPESVPGSTVNRACGSSQQAIDFAAATIMAGQNDVVIAGGVESMTRVPMGAGRDLGRPFGSAVRERYSAALTSGEFPNQDFNQGIGAERIARAWKLSRTQLDEYAVRSHRLAARATDEQRFAGQLMSLRAAPTFVVDEGIRPTSSVESLAGLRPAFQEGGVIHAGNSSQISDGAAAVLLMSDYKARQLGLAPIVRYVGGAVAGSDPLTMLTGPIPATERALARAHLCIADIGVAEVNEAFASVVLAWQAQFSIDPQLLNPLGGAIAVGHPLGASGAVLMTRLVHHMRDNNVRYGLQVMCEGGGTANATIVELVQ